MGEVTTKLGAAETFLGELMTVARATALAEMASGVAHELNQPLAAIATFSHAGERMLNRPAPLIEGALDVFRQISKEALGAGDRLQRIRRLFEREAACTSRHRMTALVTEALPVLSAAAGRANATVGFDAPAALPEISGERLRIQNVLLALVQNAVDASASVAGEREIRIDVSVKGPWIETGVSDRGAGVAEEHAQQLWRPFFTTKPGGIGLGLAATRAIVEAHEGTMGFENLAGGGARFWFRLPIVAGAAQTC